MLPKFSPSQSIPNVGVLFPVKPLEFSPRGSLQKKTVGFLPSSWSWFLNSVHHIFQLLPSNGLINLHTHKKIPCMFVHIVASWFFFCAVPANKQACKRNSLSWSSGVEQTAEHKRKRRRREILSSCHLFYLTAHTCYFFNFQICIMAFWQTDKASFTMVSPFTDMHGNSTLPFLACSVVDIYGQTVFSWISKFPSVSRTTAQVTVERERGVLNCLWSRSEQHGLCSTHAAGRKTH